jgi:hypothetical protein
MEFDSFTLHTSESAITKPLEIQDMVSLSLVNEFGPLVLEGNFFPALVYHVTQRLQGNS